MGIEPTTSGSGNRRASIAPRGLALVSLQLSLPQLRGDGAPEEGRLAQWKSARSAYGRSRVRTPQCPPFSWSSARHCLSVAQLVEHVTVDVCDHRVAGSIPAAETFRQMGQTKKYGQPGSNRRSHACGACVLTTRRCPPLHQDIAEDPGKQNVVRVGFEPTPPKRLRPERSALDHSARSAPATPKTPRDSIPLQRPAALGFDPAQAPANLGFDPASTPASLGIRSHLGA